MNEAQPGIVLTRAYFLTDARHTIEVTQAQAVAALAAQLTRIAIAISATDRVRRLRTARGARLGAVPNLAAGTVGAADRGNEGDGCEELVRVHRCRVPGQVELLENSREEPPNTVLRGRARCRALARHPLDAARQAAQSRSPSCACTRLRTPIACSRSLVCSLSSGSRLA